MHYHYDNDYSDEEDPEHVTIEEQKMIEETVYFKKVAIVNELKEKLSSYPEFVGIMNMNSVDLFNALVNSFFKKTTKKFPLNSNVEKIFNDYYMILFMEVGTKEQYNYVIYQIMKKIYV